MGKLVFQINCIHFFLSTSALSPRRRSVAPTGDTHSNFVGNAAIKPAPNLVSDAGSEVGHREIRGAYCFARMGAP